MRFSFLFLCLAVVTSLQANPYVSEKPCTIISGSTSQLNRPEGLAFSPRGDCLAVANTRGNCLTLYKRISKKGPQKYENAPFCLILQPIYLNYVHDVQFSPCGNYLGAVSREKHTVTIYERSKKEKRNFEAKPHCIIRGSNTKINFPASLAFTKDGQTLIIANRIESGLTFYSRIHNNDLQFWVKPFHQIMDETFFSFNLSSPHALSLSPNGHLLAVIHKPFYKNPLAQGQTAFAIYEANPELIGGFKTEPSFICPASCKCLHSISFHPSGKYLAVSGSESVILYKQVDNTCEFQEIHSIPCPFDPESQEGPKGVAFSPDGLFLAISAQNEVLIYDVLIP